MTPSVGQTLSAPVPAGTAEIYLQVASGMTPVWFVTIQVNLGAADSGASASAPPVPAALTVGTADCADSAMAGFVGEWLQLATTCTVPSAKPGAVLLGWATTPDFPVAIAQRQSDNKWGVYEIFDANGQLTAVFIPARWEAFVSGSNTLYPIWSK